MNVMTIIRAGVVVKQNVAVSAWRGFAVMVITFIVNSVLCAGMIHLLTPANPHEPIQAGGAAARSECGNGASHQMQAIWKE